MQFLLLFYTNDLCRHSQTRTVGYWSIMVLMMEWNLILNEIKSKRQCSEKRHGECIVDLIDIS